MMSVSGGRYQLKLIKLNSGSWPNHKIQHLAVIWRVIVLCWCLYRLLLSRGVYQDKETTLCHFGFQKDTGLSFEWGVVIFGNDLAKCIMQVWDNLIS